MLLCPDQSLVSKLENTDVPPSNRYSIKLGGSYEKEFSEGVDVMIPEGILIFPLEPFLISFLIKPEVSEFYKPAIPRRSNYENKKRVFRSCDENG